jgi:uncharacterized protein YrrD
MELKYITDGKRHLICVPYTIENLHKMASELKINKCWFHKNHYDIPKKRIQEIEKKCIMVSSKEIVEIIKSPQYAEIIISDSIKGTAAPSDHFWQTQINYNG